MKQEGAKNIVTVPVWEWEDLGGGGGMTGEEEGLKDKEEEMKR